jgi:hypothetical protein
MADQGEEQRRSLLQSAVEEFLERTWSVANLVGSVGSGALGAMPEPLPATVNRMLGSLKRVMDQVPPFTAEIDVLLLELHAKRLTVQALQAELSAFDQQLDVLERSLAPMEGWIRQWTRLHQSLAETLHSTEPEQEPPAE